MSGTEEIDALVIGAGPAGLMAAERLAAAGHRVLIADAKPSAGRKLPDGRQIRPQPHDGHGCGRIFRPLLAWRGPHGAADRGIRPGRGPGLGPRARTGGLHRLVGPRVPPRDESLAAAARLARTAGGIARHAPDPLALDRPRRRGGDVRDARRAAPHSRARDGAGARRRVLGAARLGRGLDGRPRDKPETRSRLSSRRMSASASIGRRKWRSTSARR